MKRETAIKKLLELISLEALIKLTFLQAKEHAGNYPLQLLNASLQLKEDKTNNWFTALGMLCVFRANYTLGLLQDVRKASGQKPFSKVQKRNLLNGIAQGAKLTKADAG